ncbi:Similar to SMYD4: SET and MYND domain-containing protein 4 (Pongo abelii), partial [Cotesia congregata]
MDPATQFWSNKCVACNVPGRVDKNYDVAVELSMQRLLECEAEHPTLKYQLKCRKTAALKIKEGNNYYLTQGKNGLALVSYTEGIAYAPLNSKELAKGYANRSAVTCELGLHHDSLKDIERALDIGYPDDLKAKLFARRARNLLSLDEDMRPEVELAMAEARRWANLMTFPQKRKILNVLNNIMDFVAISDFPEDRHNFTTTSNNSKILRASDFIAIKYNDKFGRHIVATRNIDAGETAFVHESYAAVVTPEQFYRFCWYCLKKVYSGIPCHQCVNVIYCDEDCLDAAWKEHHHIECPMITSMVSENMKEKEFLALRMFIKAFKEMGSVKNLQDHVRKLNSINDPINKLLTDGVFDDTKYASVFGLTSDTSFVWSSPSYTYHLKSIFIVYYLAATSDNILDRKITVFKDLADDRQTLFIASLLLKHFDINLMNAQKSEISDYDVEEDHFNRGIMLLPLMSLFNHSCDFNMCYYMSGHKVALNAVKMIKKDEQLTINYGADFQLKQTHARKSFLQTRYNFTCDCVACVNDWSPDSEFPFFYAITSPESMSRILDAVEENFEQDLSILGLANATEIVENFNSHRLRGLLKILKVYDEEGIKFPSKESSIISIIYLPHVVSIQPAIFPSVKKQKAASKVVINSIIARY